MAMATPASSKRGIIRLPSPQPKAEGTAAWVTSGHRMKLQLKIASYPTLLGEVNMKFNTALQQHPPGPSVIPQTILTNFFSKSEPSTLLSHNQH